MSYNTNFNIRAYTSMKKREKKERKKTSEIIIKIISQRRPFETKIVCLPCKVTSRQMSRHH
jgi:hypothetical protein